MKSYIVEKTESEAINLAKKLYSAGKIKSYSIPKKIISHRGRITKTIFYKYEIECEEQ